MKPGDGGGDSSDEFEGVVLDESMLPHGRKDAISEARAGLSVAAPV